MKPFEFPLDNSHTVDLSKGNSNNHRLGIGAARRCKKLFAFNAMAAPQLEHELHFVNQADRCKNGYGVDSN